MKNKKMMATLTCFVVAMAIVGCTSSKSPDTNKQKETTTESVTVESNLENSLTQNNNEQNNQPSSESQTVASKESIGIKIEDNDSKADIADIWMKFDIMPTKHRQHTKFIICQKIKNLSGIKN
mgnify:CR=1 FL=1